MFEFINTFVTAYKARNMKPIKDLMSLVTSRWIGWGMTVTDLNQDKADYVKKAYMANHFVYQTVNFITTKAARVPIRLYQKGKDSELKEIQKHPILDLLAKPNKYQGSEEFTNQVLGYKLIVGNSYIYTPKLEAGANMGKPYELQSMPAHLVEIKNGRNWMEPIGGYTIQYAPDVVFTPEEVIHMRYPAYDFDLGDFYGMSPLKPLLNVVNKSNANMLAAKSSFENGGAAGILTDEAVEEAQGLSGEQAKQLEDRWGSKFSGPTNKNKILVTVGKLKYQSIGLSPVDLNMIQDHDQTRRDIASVYGLASSLFNDVGASTRDNIMQARKAAWTDAIMPLLDGYVDELNRALTPLWSEDLILKADYSGVEELQQDKATQSEWLSKAWWLTGDEKRKIMGYESDELIGEYFVPSGLIPYEKMPPLQMPPDDQQ